MKPLSYIHLQDRYGGKFVAVCRGKVIANAKTSKGLFDKIKNYLGDKHLFIQHIDPKGAVCAYRIPPVT